MAKYCKIYSQDPDRHLLTKVAQQLDKVDPQAAQKELRSYGTTPKFKLFSNQDPMQARCEYLNNERPVVYRLLVTSIRLD